MNTLKKATLYKNHNGKIGKIGTWTIEAEATGGDSAQLVISHAKVIGGAEVVSTVPVAGKNIGRANETSPAQQAVLELDSRIAKQIDKGYVFSLENAQAPATNALGLELPMLAQPIDKVNPDKIDWENAWAQPKLDGHRCLFKGMLYSRGGKEILMPHIREAVFDLGLDKLHLDGELYIHGVLLQDIGSLVKRLRPESQQLEYHLYDRVSSTAHPGRIAGLQEMIERGGSSPIKLVSTAKVGSRSDLDEMHREFLGAGYEGTILRHGLTGYETGKRSSSLIKLKDFTDEEFTVIGVKAGTPRTLPNGRVLNVPVWICANPGGKAEDDKTFDVTAAGDMWEKDAQWDMQGSLIGERLTVQIFGRSKAGVPLLPVALRWREDL